MQDWKYELEQLEAEKDSLEDKLKKAQEYREKYFKSEEENDHLQGLTTQEMAKVKHMVSKFQDQSTGKSSSRSKIETQVQGQTHGN